MRASLRYLAVCILIAGCAHTGAKSPRAASAPHSGAMRAVPESEQDRRDRRLRGAVEAASLQEVERYLKDGGNPNQRDLQRRPLLFAAYDTGGPMLVEALLDGGADVNAADAKEVTLLMLGAWRDDLEIVQLLLARGATIDLQLGDGWTALAFAALKGHVKIMRALVSGGANPRAGGLAGFPPVALALHSKRYGAGDFMIDTLAADPEGVGQLGYALEYAAYLDEGSQVRRIVQTAQREQVLREHGVNALWRAICKCGTYTVEVLIGAGVDLNAELSNGFRPVQVAASTRCPKVLTQLLDAGVDPNARAKNGATALMLSVEWGCLPSARLLLAHHADPDLAAPETGTTPLMRAVELRRPALVRLLLESGANAQLTNSQGKTALDLARSNSYDDIVALFAAAEN